MPLAVTLSSSSLSYNFGPGSTHLLHTTASVCAEEPVLVQLFPHPKFAQVTLKARQDQQQFLALSINTERGVVSFSGNICLLLCVNVCFARRIHALVWELLSAKSQSV